eukprot:TRINITY_DN5276_c0_g1_i2.p1 TRINITY_DN5276_c0_g1~~TRINITY_DN5276_c0_g1_i2.p1  ORF type:complete len:202 (-),score=18.70 TRINITY_DN5276_c0_g1_i2:1762-2367(-)
MVKLDRDGSSSTSGPTSGNLSEHVVDIKHMDRHFSKASSVLLVTSKPQKDQELMEGKKGQKIDSKETGDLPRAKLLVRSRVEPKVFFANERTFLSWLGIAVLLLFTSLSLLSINQIFGNKETQCAKLDIACRAGQFAGVITAPMALLIMVYALVIYRKRTFQILRKDMVRIDDQCGPTFITIMLMFVMTLAYVLTLVAAFR